MNIYVSTSNKGIHIIEAFQHLLNRYWCFPQQPVIILGWDQPPDFKLASNFSFVSLGKDTGPKICGSLLDFFSGVEDEHFIYTVDSQLIIRPVDVRLFYYLYLLLLNSDRVGRISLVGNMEKRQPYSATPLAEYEDFALVEHSQDSDYRLSAIWSMWSKGYFLKYLKPDWDLWEWETAGSEQARRDGTQILSTFGRYLITPCRIYKRGQQYMDSFRSWDKYGAEMLPEDQAAVRSIMRGPTWYMAGKGIEQ